MSISSAAYDLTGDYDLPGGACPWDYEAPIPDVADWEYDQHMRDVQSKLALRISDFVETSILVPNATTRAMEPFSFAERPYLKKIYNSTNPRVLLMAGRQVEKTVVEDSKLLNADGSFTRIEDLDLGHPLACLMTYEGVDGVEAAPGTRMTTSPVTWKSRRYRKPCVRVRTRQGHVMEIATTHPVRVWAGWRDGGDIRAGDRVAVVRRSGEFFDEKQKDARVKITAFMIGDGCCSSKSMSFTNMTYDVLDDFDQALCAEGMDYTFQPKKGTKAVSLLLPKYKAQEVHDWFAEDGLTDTNSYTKFVPSWVFRLSREQTALFLNRLWATDGHVKMNTDSKWSIEYCSMSQELVLQVQALLWKFGIPSCIRENWPNIYKKRGEKKLAYILRVETQEGVRAFVREIGALGKIERQELEPWSSNSNTDTYPTELARLVHDIYREVPYTKGAGLLGSYGLERLPRGAYCIAAAKLRTWIRLFRSDVRYDQRKVDLLEAHLATDVYWDEVETVEDLGERWCRDITVEDHHNFVVGGVITHNSSALGYKTLAMSCLIPHFKTLYVSPSAAQTKEFSKTRIKEALDTSPDLRQWFPAHLTDNVFEKKAINRSAVTLRYAFLNADRCRGISCDAVYLDEFQHLLLEVIPVIEEAASHSPYKFFTYAGTPLSLDNPIEHYWSTLSTQNEWAVPCDRHGTPKNPGSWHWNILGENNIGDDGLVCDRCRGRISAADPRCTWVRTGSPDPNLSIFEGFRIPQLMVPWVDWKDLLTKKNKYSRAQFFNECLGRSYDSGQRPLCEADIKQNCDETQSMQPEAVQAWREKMRGIPLYAGIDWGQDSNNSHTVIYVGGYLNGRFRCLFTHRFTGAEAEPRVQMEKICRIIDTFQIQKVGCDHGGGYWPNDELLRRYGSGRVFRFQYSQPGVFMNWDGQLGRYLLHRSEVMSAIFNAIKRGGVVSFPKWSEFENPFAKDFLSIFSEYNEKMHMTQYKKSPNNTDDTFHAFLLSFVVSMLDIPRPDVFVPNASVDRLLQET